MEKDRENNAPFACRGRAVRVSHNAATGRSAVWSARQFWVLEAPGSNPGAPTIAEGQFRVHAVSGGTQRQAFVGDERAMNVRIYQPSKTAMQSGRAKTHRWMLDYEIETPRRPEPLMGWTSSGDTLNQVRLSFETKEEAIAFAEREGWSYTVQEAAVRRVRPRNYADNFRTDRPRF